MFAEEEIVKSHDARGKQLSLIIAISFVIVLARLWYLQIYKGELFLRYSLENKLREEVIRAPRGMIFDRNQELIVDNQPRFDVVVTPQYLVDKKKTLDNLSAIIKMPIESIEKIIQKNSTQAKYRAIIIKKNLTNEEVSLIETDNERLPGVSVEMYISRQYKDKDVGAHLLGYISEISQEQLPLYRKRDNYQYRLGDFIGQFGLEKQMDRYLRGENGHEFVEVDALGRKRKYINTDRMFKSIEDIPPTWGYNIKLSIDQEMQKLAYEALQGKEGSVVAIDVNTGEVLTMISAPSFMPEEFSKGLTSDYWAALSQDLKRPLRDRAIQDHYSPGSTFKVFTAMAALSEKTLNENAEVYCSGGLKFGNKTYHCWKKQGHGYVNLNKAIRESCNVYFQRAAMNLGINAIHKYATMFGLGSRTGIELPREVSGLIPNEEWKLKKNGIPWQQGETLSCAIGQSYVLSTTLQLAVAYAAIANGGRVLRPHLILEVFDNNGQIVKQYFPEVLSESTVQDDVLQKVRRGLYEVANVPSGTAYYYRGKGLQLAGKTGTAQVRGAKASEVYKKCENMPYEYRHHGLFVGFLPYQSPKIAIAALIEHGCHGSTAAVPVVTKLAELYMKKYQPDLYQKNLEIEQKLPAIKKPKPEEEEIGEVDSPAVIEDSE